MTNNKVMSLRDKILSAKDLKAEKVYIEEWDVEVEIRSLTGKSRANLMSEAMDKSGKMDFEKLYPELIISCTFDPESGDQVFNKTDKEVINSKSGGALEKIARVAMKLSGLTEESMVEAEKN